MPDQEIPAVARRSDWRISWLLVLLSAIPILAGMVRLAGLSRGGPITVENARFFASPLPVAIHIVAATCYCILGAFQFAPAFRRRRPRWHRLAGRVLVPCGLASALSGIWMTLRYPLPPGLQGPLLYGFRIIIGSVMFGGLAWGLAAILRRDIRTHRAWMMRAYAIGQGAGTQALILLPWTVAVGEPLGLTRDLLMITAWIINLAVAEWTIGRRPAAG